MSGHTPGPWNVVRDDSITGAIDYIVSYGSRVVAVLYEDARPASGLATIRADAELIARAPEMAAEIERLRDINAELIDALRPLVAQDCESWGCYNSNDPYHDCAPERARATLAKAEVKP
jgi:hypothetical protein